jgi:glycosyltransferase involved in cell wall biosynthesis
MSDAATGGGGRGVKVLRIIARLNVGGPARHVTWLTSGLRAFSYDTTLLTGVPPPGEEEMTAFVAAHGIVPRVIPEMSREITLRDVGVIWKVFRLLLRTRPAIVHTHTAKAGAAGRIAAFLYRYLTPGTLIGRPRRCRTLHTFHGHVFHGYYGAAKSRLFVRIERALARITDCIVVISPQQLREIRDGFGVGRSARFEVIRLGIDFATCVAPAGARDAARRELGIGEGEIAVGIVGRLTPIKNHRLFLDVAAQFAARPDALPVRFVVVGDGELRRDLESYSNSPNVLFAGSRDDMARVYAALDAVALTSSNEGTPLSLIEGMAASRPFVATAVGGVVDLAGGETDAAAPSIPGVTFHERGVLVHDGSDAAFAAALAALLADRDRMRAIAEAGHRYVVEEYSTDRLLRDIDALYRDLLSS